MLGEGTRIGVGILTLLFAPCFISQFNIFPIKVISNIFQLCAK